MAIDGKLKELKDRYEKGLISKAVYDSIARTILIEEKKPRYQGSARFGW